jgi:hypothetical protein
MAGLLALAGCVGGTAPEANMTGGVPRDARGEPVLTAIPPPPPAPPVMPMPDSAAVAVPVTGAAASVTIPPAPPALLPPAKPVSCQHYKRCL